ncbi:MAG: NAD(P)/FAD-dependent oxidoreductase [Syntrophomonadaceae bacterium]
MNNIVVIGGGPAGMMAAATAAREGADVTLLEKKSRVGRKLAITGKGRCNITTAVEPEYLPEGFPGQARFLYSAFNEFNNLDTINFFNNLGVATKVERGNRVFPQSDRALDVVRALHDNAVQAGVEIVTSCTVEDIITTGKKVTGVKTRTRLFKAQSVIICTGGKSYPATGSTGDGYEWARKLGHKIIEPRPGLVPLITEEHWVPELQGLTLKNVGVIAYSKEGKKINEEFGEMLFTHFGLSGPIILTISRDIASYIYKTGKEVKVVIDLKPALDEEKLDDRLQRDFLKYSRRQFANSLDDLLPHKLIPVLVKLSGIDPHQECNHINRKERKNLAYLLKHLTVTVKGTRPIEEAIVTAGGIDVSQVNPRSMESKLITGLYFAGEVLDVDGYTGGYNLQASFSTGYVAGKNAAQALLRQNNG